MTAALRQASDPAAETASAVQGGGSLVRRAMEAVTDHMRHNDLRVGDTLPGEAFFATEVGVSRAVMREAFGALAALRLIDVANGRKPKVAAADGAAMGASLNHAVSTAQISVAEVWDVRRTIEVRTAALAATNRTFEQAERILQLAGAMQRDGDDFELMTRHDIALHEAIAEASGNLLFVQIVGSFRALMRVAVPAAWRTRTAEAHRATMIERHLGVARAIAAGDASAAASAMEAHFDASIGDILKSQQAGTSNT